MELILHTVNDSENTIGKTLGEGLVININLKRGVNLTTPAITLANIPGVDFSDYNYANIPALGRMYFINQVESLNSRVWILELTCDVLETYKADILAANCRYMRNIKTGDYLDTSIDMSTLSTVEKYESNVTAFTNESSLILTTVGA